MDLNFTDVIAVFDIGRTWKRFMLFDRSLNPVHTEERIIAEARDEQGQPCEDIPAITAWMEACLKGVEGSSLYRFAGLNLAAGDEALPKLEKALKAILKSGIAGDAAFSGKGISSTAASLVPYLKGSDKPFILVSTGTSCTFMNPSETGNGPGGQTGTVITAAGRKVITSKFRLGEIHDMNVTRLDDHFGVTGELYKTIRIKHKKILKIQSNRRGRVFFRHGIPEGHTDTVADLSHFLTYADAYHQMMYDLVDECLTAYREIIADGDTTEIVYVTGGFALNDTFTRTLAARIPEKRVYASTIEYATALGAAMEVYRQAFDAELPPVYLGLKAILLRDE
jgi:hypothetical protein